MTILSQIQQYFGADNVVSKREDNTLYRCVKYTAAGAAYQIVYLDYSLDWLDADFRIDVDHHLTVDYYDNPGPIQWNYYYYFIAPQSLINENSEQVRKIEKDEYYARKFVQTEEQFAAGLTSVTNTGRADVSHLTTDLYTQWISLLREHKLFFVYNEATYPNYKQWVDECIAGSGFQDVNDYTEALPTVSQQPALKRIRSLDIQQFRQYPLRKNFDFGKVNLVFGPNATGKTSFFDALELVITGASNGYTPSDYRISIKDSENIEFSFPDESYKYKQRDVSWYKSAFTRGHNLGANFNRFNYYASDAAFVLHSTDRAAGNNFDEVIADIALGREVNRLEERIIEFKKRFEGARDDLRRQKSEIEANIKEKKEKIDLLRKEIKDPEQYKIPLLDKLRELKWTREVSSLVPAEMIVSIETSLSSVSNCLAKIIARSTSSVPPSAKLTNEEITRLEQLDGNIERTQNLLANERQVNKGLVGQISKVTKLLELLDELRQYLQHPNCSSISGITERRKDIDNKIKEAELIREALDGLQPFPENINRNIPVGEYESDCYEKSENIQRQLTDKRGQIAQIEEGISELSQIVSNIKSSGEAFIRKNLGSSDCPLCNTEFADRESLVAAIEKSASTFSNSDVLTRLKVEVQSLVEDDNANNKLMAVLKGLQKIKIPMAADEYSAKTITEILIKAEAVTGGVVELRQTAAEIDNIIDLLTLSELSEERLSSLLQQLSAYGVDQFNSLDALQKFYESEHVKLKELLAKIEKSEIEIERMNRTLAESFDSYLTDRTVIAQELLRYKEIKSWFEQVNAHIELDDDDNVFKANEKINLIQSLFDAYKTEFLAVKENAETISFIEKEIEGIDQDLLANNEKLINASTAYSVLEKITTEHSKNAFLSGYIAVNKNDISDVFTSIHSPKEFSAISFEGGHLHLIPRDGSDARALHEISTGQRTALALSIFLSLNKKLAHGPYIILLDDPVTYVDDLNTLSFIDYLRELALNSNRQLFFATANNDLAFLFKKKFDCMGPEFQVFPLERTPA